MKIYSYGLLILLLIVSVTTAQVQEKDKAIFTDESNPFLEKMEQQIEEFKKPEHIHTYKDFQMDMSGMVLPDTISQFKYQWHQPPQSQGNTGTCWSFSTTSYFESEIFRLSGRKIKLSEMYTVYWEYVEKARRFVQERGGSLLVR
jgi:bleomycin hydrolase